VPWSIALMFVNGMKMQPMDDTYGWTQTRLETLVT